METTKNLMKSNAGIGGWTGHTCQSEPLISVISQKPTNRWIAMIRQSNHWIPLYFAFCRSSNEFVCYDSILGIQSLHAQEGFWNFTHLFWLYSDTSFCGLCHVTIWPARIGICHWRFWFTQCPIKTLTLVQDPPRRTLPCGEVIRFPDKSCVQTKEAPIFQ